MIQWDKDDLDAVGLMKIDVLALGMLSALRRGRRWCRHGAPGADAGDASRANPAGPVGPYEMLSPRADSVGVFQVESRAQMTMLPRLRPQRFYDLVVEVAIVRPGPDPGRHGPSLPAGAPRGAGEDPMDGLRRDPRRCSRARWACRSSRSR